MMRLYVKSMLVTLLLLIQFSIIGTNVQIYNNTNLKLTTLPDNGAMYPGEMVITTVDAQEKALLQSPHDWFVYGKSYNDCIIIAIEGIRTYKVQPLMLSPNQIGNTIVSINKQGPKISLSFKKEE